MKTTFIQLFALVPSFLGFSLHADAVIVNWSASFYGTHQDSQGETVNAGYTFELGAFADGFVPSASNTSEWAQHWMAADSVAYNESNGNFASATDTQASSLAPGTKTFVWGFDRRAIEGGAEWVLLSSADWYWPGASAGSENPALVWTVADAGESVLGLLNSKGAEIRMAQVVTASPGTSPEDWIAENFDQDEAGQTEVAGWDADPDADGMANILEYAFGFDPKVSDAANGPVQEMLRENGALIIRIQVPHHAQSQAEIFLEKSDDLREWTRDEQATQQGGGNLPGMLIFDSPVDPDAVRSFRRLRVSLPQKSAGIPKK